MSSYTPNQTFTRLVELLKGGGVALGRRTGDDAKYAEFIRQFPANSISKMDLEQYCIGSKSQSFCWWLERGLEPVLGRYMPGTARGHLIYIQKDGSYYTSRTLADLSIADALAYTLKIQELIAKADPREDVYWIDSDTELYRRAGVEARITMGNGRKLRLLSMYHPDDVLPITSMDHIKHFLIAFGVSPGEIAPDGSPVLRSKQLARIYEAARAMVPQITPFDFMDALYRSELAIAPERRIENYGAARSAAPTERSAEMMQLPVLNSILYGPPGTGKTHLTIEKTLEILDPGFLRDNGTDRSKLKAKFDELAKLGLVRFVTFHQSFSYEDFVEGLRATTDADGRLRYEVVDGVFKSLCVSASARTVREASAAIDVSGRKIWKMSLGNTLGPDSYIYDECIENGYALLGYGGTIDFSGCFSREAVVERFAKAGKEVGEDDYGVTAVNTYINRIKPGDLIVVSDGNFKLRAIGEFKSSYRRLLREEAADGYGQCRDVNWLRVYSPSLPYDQLMRNQFSQMTLYELKPGSIDVSKLTTLLGEPSGAADTSSISDPFTPGQQLGTSYRISKVTAETIEISKRGGTTVPITRKLIDELARMVDGNKISLEDIWEKRVYDKVPNFSADKYIVNGYQNILYPLVEKLLTAWRLTGAKGAEGGSAGRLARVLVIDEINRGNVSRILGELITLIEPSKRAGNEEALEVILPYSKTAFSVPNNVYLIGTMNTADRSLTGIDVALRRRFAFVAVPPRPDLLDETEVEGVNIGQLLRCINGRIEALLDRDHCLGHAYFLPLREDPTLAALARIFRGQVLPLLEEYFFEDWERIRWVLNDHRRTDPGQCFIVRPLQGMEQLFGSNVLLGSQDNRWQVNPTALTMIASYEGIIEAD